MLNNFHLRILIAVAAVAFGAAFSFAFSGTEGAAFLDIPVGARPAALGSAYSALATDAYAPTYNPAGLPYIHATEVAGQHTAYVSTLHQEYLSLSHPLGERDALGVAFQYIGSGDIAGTSPAGDSIGPYNSYYAAYNLAYGHRFTDRLSLGLGGKVIHGKLADATANAFAGDAGVLFKANSRLNLAAVVTNWGSSLKFISQSDPLPMAVKLGAAYDLACWTLAVEGAYRRAGLASFHTGLEWRPASIIALRAGYRTDTVRELSALAGFTTGVGLRFWGQEFSYAWLPLGELGNTNYFSLVLRFGGSNPEGRVIQTTAVTDHSMNELLEL